MKFMSLLLAGLPLCLLAQTPAPTLSPSDSREPSAQPVLSAADALRTRAQKFLDANVAGKPRSAEAFVCEDGKDDYYQRPLPPFSSAQVTEVKVSVDSQSAVVTSSIRRAIPILTRSPIPLMPFESNWRFESGQWCYAQPPTTAEVLTPYGKIDFSNGTIQIKGGLQGEALLRSLAEGISFSKQTFSLPIADSGKDAIVVTNGTGTTIQLAMQCPDFQGLTCRLDRSQVQMHSTATLTLEFQSAGAPLKQPLTAAIVIDPFGRVVQFPIIGVK
jgi:hypothetical protein